MKTSPGMSKSGHIIGQGSLMCARSIKLVSQGRASSEGGGYSSSSTQYNFGANCGNCMSPQR